MSSQDAHEGEAHVPAEHSAPKQDARISSADVHQEWPAGVEAAPREGATAPDGLGRGLRRFTRDERLQKRRDFERAYNEGIRISGRLMTVFVVSNASTRTRLGVAATRKLGPAVVRNRAKRLARELFRRHKGSVSLAGHDIVVVPRREMLDAPVSALDADYSAALARRDRAQPATPRRRSGRRGARPAARV